MTRPFFVYGTLRPGAYNHDRFLLGRTVREEPARLPGGLLYEGPGYPYAVPGEGEIAGELLTAAPGAYGELLSVLDALEEYFGPGHPLNLYERAEREVVRVADGTSVLAWVYFAAPGTLLGEPVAGGDWFRRETAPRSPGAPRTP
ncbi:MULTISPECIES: gamma-glutamylcyclotransferase family protein [Streptomyces]|uniref:gamma-glutamylcyclotransferase family protein n=1 Tax=Streptomyces TaxID=1883 RepID=UPI0013170646|nr:MULTISPECIES: gamma-glutamylcyclotransferase family protein [Streptomyces]QGZ48817.1 gamma-glutamylcyclotransferase [Streptomyces sp. QHH-9511]GGU16671.1 gamma-glutamylcyclotransferase [Streptomyces lateritius]